MRNKNKGGTILVYEIVHLISQELKKKLNIGEDCLIPDFETMESITIEYVKQLSLKVLQSFIEDADQKLLVDKAKRKAQRLIVQRKNDLKTIYSALGNLQYRRIYYRDGTNDDAFCYPVDRMLAIESHERLSPYIETALVKEALNSSYERSSQYVTNGTVSKQTVMNKIRQSIPVKEPIKEKRHVPILHIDADEAHVSLQNGKPKNTMVPVICVYEGIKHEGTRGMCVNPFYILD